MRRHKGRENIWEMEGAKDMAATVEEFIENFSGGTLLSMTQGSCPQRVQRKGSVKICKQSHLIDAYMYMNSCIMKI
jgi:hypothetical protein